MPTTQTARRYATALLEIAKEEDAVEAVLEDIQYIHDTQEDSRELVNFLKSPVINYDDKADALETLFFDEIEEVTRLFLKLLVRKERINLLDGITEAFIDKYNNYAGIINVSVTVALELNADQRSALHKNLEQKTGLSVNMEVTQNKSLKGGMTVRIKDTVIDGSVKHKLDQLEESFLSSARH